MAGTINGSMAKQVRRPAQRRAVRHHLKAWRKYRDLTQEQLAERIDRTRGLIAQYESGGTEIPEPMLYALADALQCAPWDILRVDPSKEGAVVDITDHLRQLSPDAQAEALGYVRGLVASQKKA